MSVFNEPTVDFHLSLNEQQFHIPNELLKQNLKQCQRLINKELGVLKKSFLDLSTVIERAENEKESIDKLNELIIKVEKLERKISKRVNVEYQLLERIQARIKYYRELEEIKKFKDKQRLINWYQSYTDLLIGDYLTRNGNFYENKGSEDVRATSAPSIRHKRKLSSSSSQVTTASTSNDQEEHADVNPGVEYLKQQGLDLLLDYDILLTTNKISKQLLNNHKLDYVLDWIKENATYLKNTSSMLEFEVRFQEYIEYVKAKNYSKAIICFQTHLIKFLYSNPLELKLAAGLLVFIKTCKSNLPSYMPNVKPDEIIERQSLFQAKDSCWSFFFMKLPKDSDRNNNVNVKDIRSNFVTNTMEIKRYMVLLDDKRWEKLNEMFLKAYYSMYEISYHDPLLIYLSLGISSLKTKDCLHKRQSYLSSENELGRYLNTEFLQDLCPVCSPDFAPIAEKLPHAHQVQSRLFDNPVMLPSGNVYDSEKLKLLANNLRKNNQANLRSNEVLDPITGHIYSLSDFVTMYPT